jgi:hypothetical protein
MAAQPCPAIPNSFRFEFDAAHKILLGRVEGRLTEALVTDFDAAVRKHSIATDANAGIWDLSSVTQVSLSFDFVVNFAQRESVTPDAARRPHFIIVPAMLGSGMVGMFQSMARPTRPLLKVVKNVDEALAELGVQSPDFEPLT